MFQEDLSIFIKDFGEDVAFTLADNTTLTIKAIFDEAYIDTRLGVLELQVAKPTLTCVFNDYVKQIKKGYMVLIRGKNYIVFKNPYAAPDNPGFALIDLAQ